MNLSIESLVEAVLRIDDLKKDHLVRLGVEKEARAFVDAKAVHFFFYNEQKKVLYRPLSKESHELFHNQAGLLSEMAYNKKDGFVEGNRLVALESSMQLPQVRGGSLQVKNVYVSLIGDRKRLYGLLVAFNLADPKSQQKTFDGFASMLAITLRRYKILNPEIQRVRENKSVTALNQFLFRTRSKSGFLEKVVDLLHRHLGAERISIILKNSRNNRYEFAAGRSIEPEVLLNGVVTLEDNVLAWVLAEGKGILCPNIQEDDRFGRNKTLRYKKQSFISIPVLTGDGLVGFLSLTDKRERSGFDKKDYNFAQSLVGSLGQGLAFLKSVESDSIGGAGSAPKSSTPFADQYQEWLSEQKDFSFGERTFASPKNLPIMGLNQYGQPKAPNYIMSVVHVVGSDEGLVLDYKNGLDAILNYAVKHHANPKEAYKFFRRECIRFVERRPSKEAPIQLPMWLLGKEKKRLVSYIATEDFVCLHFNSRSKNISMFRLENELVVDYTDSRIQEKLIYYHSNDIVVVYLNAGNDESKNLAVKKTIQEFWGESAEAIRDKLLDEPKTSNGSGSKGSFYVFKML